MQPGYLTIKRFYMALIYEYKVIDMIDECGAVNTEKLTKLLCEYGIQGWHLVSAYSNELGKNALTLYGFTLNSTKDQNILIFERQREETEREISNRLIRENNERIKREEAEKLIIENETKRVDGYEFIVINNHKVYKTVGSTAENYYCPKCLRNINPRNSSCNNCGCEFEIC